jgi:hypothetical protein
MADWEIILGINYIVPHLVHYSLEGFRKADYPISFSRALPYAKHLRGLNDHLGRVCYSMTCGKRPVNLLVIHPAANNWVNWRNSKMLNQYAVALETLTRQLVCEQFEFDFGDEPLLQADGKVEDGQLRLAKVSYDVVIVPSTLTLFASTLRLLQEFATAGGKVYFYGTELPTMLDGRLSAEITNFIQQEQILVIDEFSTLVSKLKMVIERPVLIESPGRIMSTVRLDDKQIILFFANYENVQQKVTLKFCRSGRLYLADTCSGSTCAVGSDDPTGKCYTLELPVGGSQLVILATNETAVAKIPPTVLKKNLFSFSGPFKFERLDDNVMLLDHCSYRINDSVASEIMQVENVKRQIRQRYNFAYCDSNRYPREYSRYAANRPQDTGYTLSLEFIFDIVDEVDCSGIKLAVEVPEIWQITVNGQPVTSVNNEFFMDCCFGVMTIGDLLNIGQNKLELTTTITEDLEPENLFLLGDFAVSLNKGIPYIMPEATELNYGAITTQGYPFFGGRIKYHLPLTLTENTGQAILQFAGLGDVPVFECFLNGQLLGNICYAPYRLNLPPLAAGENTLEIVLYSHLRHIFGPHYVEEYSHNILVTCSHYNFIYNGSRATAMKFFPCQLLPGIKIIY